MNDKIDPNKSSGGKTHQVPLNDAAYNNDLELTQELIAQGAYIDGLDETGITPLMTAAREGHGEIVKLLLEAGADPCRLGYVQRVYPLDFAQWRVNDSKTLELLKDVNAPSVSMEFDTSSLRGAEIGGIGDRPRLIYP
jgi:ankyrin repeat protein